MRDMIKEFVKIVAETLPVAEPIYEFGALQVEQQVGYADLRPIFPGKKYIGCDLREGPGVDMVLDLHRIALPDECAGTVLTLDTLEHVEYPREALGEIHRILKPGGLVATSSVMNFPIHEYPYDFWRFTPDGFKSLLKPFVKSWVGAAGDEAFPHTVVGVGFKGEVAPEALASFEARMAKWRTKWFYQEGMSPEEIRNLKKHQKKKKKKSFKDRLQRLISGG